MIRLMQKRPGLVWVCMLGMATLLFTGYTFAQDEDPEDKPRARKHEQQTPEARFKAIDTDGDGLISWEEFEQERARQMETREGMRDRARGEDAKGGKPRRPRFEQLDVDDFFLAVRGADVAGQALRFDSLNLEDVEQKVVEFVMAKHQGNISHAAKELGITRTSLYRRIEKYGL